LYQFLNLQYIYQIIEFKIQKEQKKIKNCDEISKLIKAFPKDIAALDKERRLEKEREKIKNPEI